MLPSEAITWENLNRLQKVGVLCQQLLRTFTWTPDSNGFAIASSAGAKLYHFSDLKSPVRTIDFEPNIFTLDFAKQGTLVALGYRFTVNIIELEKWELPRLQRRLNGCGGDLHFSPDGKYLATADVDVDAEDVVIWETATGLSRRLTGHSMPSWMWDSRSLATCVFDELEEIAVWDIANLRQPLLIPIPTDVGDLDCLAFLPNAATIAAGFTYGDVCLWNLDHAARMTMLKGSQGVVDLSASPVARLLAIVLNDGNLRILNLSSQESMPLETGLRASEVFFSPNGAMLAVLSEKDETVQFWAVN